MSFKVAHAQVSALVELFRTNQTRYLAKQYSEQDARNDFINKFFIALGWDVRHEIQTNPYEQEVKVEPPVRVSGAQKRADYSFSLAPNYRDPIFFVEAKKPQKDLFNKDYYFQTVRYGWHKNTPLAILTDFEEFHILDCRFSPNLTTVLDRQIMRFHYTDYLNEESFAEIYWLFSKEAVQNNSIEKYAEGLPKPKGRAYQKALFAFEKHQTIDDAFLEEIDGIRVTLAKAFKKNDDSLNSEELTEATQRTIDRLVFIRFLEDKLIEPEHYVNTFGEGKSAWRDFISLCSRLDAKYNGIVFKKSFIDSNTFRGPIDSEFHEICQKICHLNSRFLFNEIPIHILGSIYERFLGKVVNATAKRVSVEEKQEVRKAGGVYYTPKYIVDYIVQNTVGKLIGNKTPEQISKFTFADIACGSGSFLIGVLECLLEYHNKYYQLHPDKAMKSGCIFKDGLWVMSIKQKQAILKSNIFGVDIDSQAVEVTQLSLALKMLEDETTATADEMQVLFHEKILPDMTRNIVCGNSLIDSDILTQSLFEIGEERKLNPLSYSAIFPDIINAGGFDIIVGNPPYGFHQIHSSVVKPYLKSHYRSANGSYEHYFLFYERTLSLLKAGGYHGYITPVTWLTIPSGKALRKFILSNFELHEINWLPELVFKNAQVNTLISIIKRNKPSDTRINIYHEIGFKKPPLTTSIVPQDKFVDSDFYIGIFENVTDKPILEKISRLSAPLSEFCRPCSGYNPYEVGSGIAPNGGSQTKETVKTKPYHSDSKLGDDWKPEIVGRDLSRYFVNVTGQRWIKYGPWLSAPRDPNNFVGRRILVQEITGGKDRRIVGAYYDKELYHSRDVIPIKVENEAVNPFFILALINSRLLSWYHHKKNPKAQKGLFPKLLVGDLAKLPIPIIDTQNGKKLQEMIITHVDQMQSVRKILLTSKTDKDRSYYERRLVEIDAQIDRCVYQLYGLSEEEIKIVES